MQVHEALLENNSVRLYLGKVDEVSRYEKPPVKDFIDQELSPMEILFSVGNIISKSRAVPLDHSNEVNQGDYVVIFSLEHMYNNTYYYHPIRYVSKSNRSIYMRYGESQLILNPIDESNTELLLTASTSIINIDPQTKRINIESDTGGVNINSHKGHINISNDRESLGDLLQELISEISNLKVLSPDGPLPVTPTSKAGLIKLESRLQRLFRNLNSSSSYPNIPEDTYTVDFAAEAVGTLGINFLNDHGEDSSPGETILNLQKKFPEDPDVDTSPNPETGTAVPPGKEVNSEGVNEEDFDNCQKDYQLSTNFKLSDVTNKTTFPHKLKSQHGLSCEDIIKNLKIVALNILEPIYAKYPNMVINSGFRGTPSLPGGRISQHEVGEAVDLQFTGFTPDEYFEASQWVVENIALDNFIFEHGRSIWFHISCKRNGSNRGKLLTMLKGKYYPGITNHY